MSATTLILCVHNHQPVGNLPEVFEAAYRDAYLPFLEAIERFPDVKLVLHNTGPLLEWYEEHAPDYIERVRTLVLRGQVEVLSGAFYEPILPAIPERDARGQILKMNRYVRETFGMTPRGMWLAERVWEPHLARIVAGADIEYVPLDDYGFRLAGLPDEALTGYFVTEDQGVPLKVFPISKRLRYSIPFDPPAETLSHLKSLSRRADGLLAVFGDDGEKFGVWPGTHSHVYGGRWLEKFLRELTKNTDWLRTSTFSEFVDREPPRGRVYLPAASYPEMMEWALPTAARRSYGRLIRRLEGQGDFDEWRPLIAGGTWKSFLAKYDEANLMLRKMYRVSDKLSKLTRAHDLAVDGGIERGEGPAPEVSSDTLERARDELWKGQCNCSYWHGIFGGLYLPHLRSAVYRNLIRAENLLDSWKGRRWDWVEVADHDLDGNDEVILESHWANVYAAPARGGTVFELDLRRAEANILATMARYDEAYHDALEDAARETEDGDGAVSIHSVVVSKDVGLADLAGGDGYARRGGVDHFFASGASPSGLGELAKIEAGDFVGGRYEFRPGREDGTVRVTMRRGGSIKIGDGARPVWLEKTVSLRPDETVRVDYSMTAEEDIETVFGSEWNLAFLTDNPDLVFLEAGDSERLNVGRSHRLEEASGVVVTDLLRGEIIRLQLGTPARVWVWPLETASQSEGGFERIFQGITIVPNWDMTLRRGEAREVSVSLEFARAEA